MDEDHSFIANYIPDRLYINPGKEGAYASIAAESIANGGEELLAELEVTSRSRVAVSAFFVAEKKDWNRLKITKLKFNKKNGWHVDGEIVLNGFEGRKVRDFLSVLNALDMTAAGKAKLDLGAIRIEQLAAIISSPSAAELVRELSLSPFLEQDIYAVAAKRNALNLFNELLKKPTTEPEWQAFFERNPWVFGYGLAFIFLHRVGAKLELATTGAAFDRAGKRVDGLLRTRAAVSQYVLVEIKKSETPLLKSAEYRPGVWTASNELSDAVSQVQKTGFEFSNGRLKDDLTDADGTLLGEQVFSVQPRCYLVIGNQIELANNSNKIASFELYRRNIVSPEIITFDELYDRAKCIVEQIDDAPSNKKLGR